MALIKRKQIEASDRNFIEISEHFIGNLSTTNGGAFSFNAVASGTGATFGILAGEAGSPGIVRQQTGTTATGGHLLRTPPSLIMTSGLWSLFFRFRIPTLSNATQTFAAQIGFGDATSSITSQTDAILIRHNQTTGVLIFIAIANGVTTAVNSTFTVVAGQWIEAEILVDRFGVANFSINGSAYTSITSNVPTTAGRDIGITSQIVKSLGTVSSFLDIDFMRLRYEA